MRIVYDCTLKRPGCVNLQAVMGGTVPEFSALFPSESWLTAPTPDMKLYDLTEEQLVKLVAITEDALKSAKEDV